MQLAPILTLVLTAAATIAYAQDDPEHPADLAALVECRASAQDYNALAFSLSDGERNDAMEALGLSDEKSGNPMLAQFRLAKPLTVFGRQTSHLVFNSGGIFAVLDEADPHPLAQELGVTSAFDRRDKFLAEKLISESQETLEESGMKLRTRITLNVSTVDSHRGKTLAGCGYRMETE